jgi:hypothetical protein
VPRRPGLTTRAARDPDAALFFASTLAHPTATGPRYRVLHRLLEMVGDHSPEVVASCREIGARLGMRLETVRSAVDELSLPGGPVALLIDRSYKTRKRFLLREHPRFVEHCLRVFWSEPHLAKDNAEIYRILERDWIRNRTRGKIVRDDLRPRSAGCPSVRYLPPPHFDY